MTEVTRKFEIEYVDQAPEVPKAPPPRFEIEQAKAEEEAARAAEERPRDFLEGFLAPTPEGVEVEQETVTDRVVEAIREIYDPELPVNIYDLGLIYNIEEEDGHVVITMTLTTPNCPVAESMPSEVEMRVLAVPGVATVEVHLVWDPPWDPSSMSDEAKLELGML